MQAAKRVASASMRRMTVVQPPVVARSAVPARAFSGRAPSSTAEYAYHIGMKNTSMYFTLLLSIGIVAEGVYGGLTNTVWNAVNHGKTYETVDWSKFASPLDDDDDDDDDEDEDDEDDE